MEDKNVEAANDEIERKWKLSDIPTVDDAPVAEDARLPIKEALIITQFYIGVIRAREIYFLKEDKYKYYLTIKSDGTISRKEFEVEIPSETYEILLNDPIMSPVITKDLIKYQLEDTVMELHIFHFDLKGLVMIECEFPDLETANKFQLPEAVTCQCEAVEVTEDKRYQNINLAKNGIPVSVFDCWEEASVSAFWKEATELIFGPLIIRYLNLLHVHKDPESAPVKKFVEKNKSDPVFLKRVKAVNGVWKVKTAILEDKS